MVERLSKAHLTEVFAREIAQVKGEKEILKTYKRISLTYERIFLTYIATL